MELLLPSNRHHVKPKIGSKYQVEIPSFKSSARIKVQEYNTRDHFYACGLAVTITRIAVDSQSASRKRRLSTDQASCNIASAVNSSRSPETQEPHISNTADGDLNGGADNGSKDANSCASSSKEKFTWNSDCATREDGAAGEGEGQAVSILPKKRKKKRNSKRNCWQPKRRVSKKPRLENYSAQCEEDDGHQEEESDCTRKFVPGSKPESWSPLEVSYFKLAIFLFGKRFCEISKFIGTKKVIDVFDYYYSKFVGRALWSRWKAAKRFDCKFSVRGDVILEGWRQAELLRRLKQLVSEDAYCEIMKATSAFNVSVPEPHPFNSDESRMAEYERMKKRKWETYVFKLKDVVGLEHLQQSIKIAGATDGHLSKRDLTSGPYPPVPRQFKEKHTSRGAGKSQHTSVISAGNENLCSLRSEDSMQSTLSVGENWMRRSTSSSEEHFWEHVWPFLKVGGWKSIERKVSIKSCPKLLFLRPGVDKIHKDEKGTSYFDNFNEVIEAVKDDPILSRLAEDNMDDLEALDQEDEARRGWSDDEDMFTTLDGKRTIVPIANPSVRARAAEDSSQSSSLDIDLNRTLSAVNSKPQVESAPKSESLPVRTRESQTYCEKSSGYPLGGIDLNLLPADNECISDDAAGEPGDSGRLECEFLDYSRPLKEQEPERVPVAVDVVHSGTELTLSIGNFTSRICAPSPPRLWLEFVDEASVQQESTEEASVSNQLAAPVQLGRLIDSHVIEIPSRKRSLSFHGLDTGGDWFDNGKDLVSLPKKRAITLEMIPRSLGELPVTTFLIRMNNAAVAQFYRGLSSDKAAARGNLPRPTSPIDMELPWEAFRKAIQDSSSLLSSSRTLKGRLTFKAFIKAGEDAFPCGWPDFVKGALMSGFQQPRCCKVVDDCIVSEKVTETDADGHQHVCASEVGEDGGIEKPVTMEFRQEQYISIQHPASLESNSPHMLTGSSRDAFQMDTEENGPFHRKRTSLKAGSRYGRLIDANTLKSMMEQERSQVPEPEVRPHEEAPVRVTKPQCQIKAIRCLFKNGGDRPSLCKERSKRVPRDYSSLVKANTWLRSDQGDFPSISESLNSCLTSDSFPAHGRDEEEAPQGAQLRVKPEDSDVMMSPTSSIRSWGTGDQDEEILSEGYEEEKPFQAECKTFREMYSPSAAGESYDSSLYKPRKSRYDTFTFRRKGSQNYFPSLDSEKKRSSTELDINENYGVTVGKRIKVSRDEQVVRSSSVVEDMYSEGHEVVPGKVKEDLGLECASKWRNKRSPPKRQVRNVSQKRFLIMLYTEIVEEELPVQSRSSQGPFQAPSQLPHLRENRPIKNRKRQPSLPCRSKEVIPQQKDLKTSASASPKRSAGFPSSPLEEEVAAAVAALKWPQEDGRFTLRRSLSDLSTKSGRQCTKRGGGRWQHCCLSH